MFQSAANAKRRTQEGKSQNPRTPGAVETPGVRLGLKGYEVQRTHKVRCTCCLRYLPIAVAEQFGPSTKV